MHETPGYAQASLVPQHMPQSSRAETAMQQHTAASGSNIERFIPSSLIGSRVLKHRQAACVEVSQGAINAEPTKASYLAITPTNKRLDALLLHGQLPSAAALSRQLNAAPTSDARPLQSVSATF